MSLFLQESKKRLEAYEKQLVYNLAHGNTILEFCIAMQEIYKDNKNELQNIQLKKIIKELKFITSILEKLVQDSGNTL